LREGARAAEAKQRGQRQLPPRCGVRICHEVEVWKMVQGC
jgi:hypothetical protein